MKPSEFADEFCRLVVERREERFRSLAQRPPQPRAHPWASDLGDCDRAMALALLAWKVRPPLPAPAQQRMEAGRVQERAVRRQLEDEGWEIVETEAPVELKDRRGRVVLRGAIDGRILWTPPGAARPIRVPLEIKDTSWANFQRWHTEEDLRVDTWSRKWWRQTQAYLLALGVEWGVFMLTHRGERRPIAIRLDLEQAEVILQRAERAADIRDALAGEELEALDEQLHALGVPYLGDRRTCASCDFHRRVCFPPQPGSQGELELLVLDDEVGNLVARFYALAEASREHDALKRRLERLIPRGKHASAGPWIVTGHWEEQDTKPTEAVPAQPAGTRKIWRRVVLRADELRQPAAAAAAAAAAESEDGAHA